VVFTGRRNSGKVDLEAVEMLVRTSMHRAGAPLWSICSRCRPRTGAGNLWVWTLGKVPRQTCQQIMTALGQVRFERSYYSARTAIKATARLIGNWTWKASRLFARRAPDDGGGGKRHQLQQGREQLQLLAGVEVTAKAVERHRRL